MADIYTKIEEAKVKFESKFTYGDVTGPRVIDKVEVTCPLHGKYTQEARVHLRSDYGCTKCAYEGAKLKQRKSQGDFISESVAIHKGHYNYDKAVYTGDSNRVVVTCLTHGDFNQVASSHLQGYGCKKCAVNVSKASQTFSTADINLQLANLPEHIKVDVYTYTNSKKKLSCVCKHHGPFLQTLVILREGTHKCPTCANEAKGWKRSLYKEKHTMLYLLKLKNGMYKVGITKAPSLKLRYGKDLNRVRTVLLQFIFLEGSIAWDIEKRVLQMFKQYKYKGPSVFKHTGNTEVLTINPLTFILKEINNA
jgi:hypothetical protein